MLEECSPLKAWLLCGFITNLHILVPQYRKRKFPWFQRFFYSLHRIDSPQRFETIIAKSKPFQEQTMIPCVYLPKKTPIPDKQFLFSRNDFDVIHVNFEKKPGAKYMQIIFSK